MKTDKPLAIVVGVSSQLGGSVTRSLEAAGYAVCGLSRRPHPEASIPMYRYDEIRGTAEPSLPKDIAVVISLAPLPAISRLLSLFDQCPRLRRVIAFGTTGIYTKADSSSPEEREFVTAQLRGEKALATWSGARGVSWTLFRPTMIYGLDEDRNVAFIRTIFRRFHCFPMPLGARGVRQPVHADDLGRACSQALSLAGTGNRAYNLGGGEVLFYEDMVRRIRLADGHHPVVVPVPRFIYYLLIHLARRFMGQTHLHTEMVDRMYADLVTDNSAAEADFGYAPRPFQPPDKAHHHVRYPPLRAGKRPTG